MSVFELWLPVLASGIACHVASTIAWTVLTHHKPEFRTAGEKENELMNWIANSGLPAGNYVFPYCDNLQEANSEVFQQRQRECVGMLSIWPAPIKMPVAIVQTLTFFVVAAWVIGYLASIGLSPATPGRDVFRFVFTAGLLTHCFAKFPHVFWFPSKVLMSLLDGAVYALLTGLLFTWLWPA